MEVYEERSDGKTVVRDKGTIKLLEEWFELNFIPNDPEPINEMIRVFKEVRKRRQKPAHSVDENVFDQKYFKEQRELMLNAYKAVRTIRLAFANNPAVQIDPPIIKGSLFRGEIWDI